MTGDLTAVPAAPAQVPAYDDLTWTAHRLPGRTIHRWSARGHLPTEAGGGLASEVAVTKIRRGGSAEDLAHQLADILNGRQNDRAALTAVLRLLDDVAVLWRSRAETDPADDEAGLRAHELENLARRAHGLARDLGALHG